MINLPKGYRLGSSKRSAKALRATTLGGEWTINVYADEWSIAFMVSKGYSVENQCVMYVGRLYGSEVYHESADLDEVIRIISTKHRLLGRK